MPAGAGPAFEGVSLGLWAVNYDVRRWSRVFPVGMYAACGFIVGDVAHVAAIRGFARLWVWVGVAVWVVTFAAMLRRAFVLARSGREPAGGLGTLR